MRIIFLLALSVGVLFSETGALRARCYECDSSVESCQGSNFGRIVECEQPVCYFEEAGAPVGNIKRKCGSPQSSLPGGGARNYCHKQNGLEFCTCTTDLCNTVYNTNWENARPAGIPGGESVDLDYDDHHHHLVTAASLPLIISPLTIVVFALSAILFIN